MRLPSYVCLVVLSLGLMGASGSHAQPYSLISAWRDAASHDAALASFRSALTVAKEQSVQANAGLLPSIGGSAAIQRQLVDTNLAPRREFTSRTLGVNLSYPLYRLQNIETFEQSRLSIGVSELQLEAARQDLMVRVAQAYFDVLASQDNLETVRTQKKAIAEQLAAAKRNFEVGTATITDQQEAQSRADLVNAQEIVAENDLVTKLAALSTLTGKPVQPLASLRQGIILAPPEPADVNSWTSGARDFNLNVSQAKIALEIAKREIDKQRYGHYPTVDLVASLQRSENPAVNFLGLRSNSAALGVQLNVPIYAGGAITARVRQAIAARDKSMTDLENAQRNVTQAARAQFLGVSSGLAQVKALEAAEKSSQLALDSNQLGYQVGVRINIDVLNAQQQLFTTRRDLAKARYDVLTNGLKLKQTAGTLKEEDLQALDAFLVAK